MIAQRKRRHVSYIWSLPLLVAIAFLAVAKLAALERAELIAELVHQVAHSDTAEATSAVRNLAAMPRPPLAQLVTAATSPNLAVAEEAQQAIDVYLRACQRDIQANHRPKHIAAQLDLLAEALDRQAGEFSVADHQWLEHTTQKLIRIANRLPAKNAPSIATRCDSILAATARQARQQTTKVSLHSSQSAAAPHASAVATNAPVSPAAERSDREQRLAEMAGRAWSHDGPSARPVANLTPDFSRHPLAAATLPANGQANLGPTRPTADADDDSPAATIPMDMPPAARADSSWRAKWMHPLLHSVRAMPIRTPSDDATETDLRTVPFALVDPLADTIEEQLQDADSRQLLRRWLTAEGAEIYPLEKALTDRGFGRLSDRLVQNLFSEDAKVRLRLIDDVLTEPGVDARPWLLLLADDHNADVRLVVVTILATSNDPRLIEKAWQVAIRDHDPRIAGLARRLRERRSELRQQ